MDIKHARLVKYHVRYYGIITAAVRIAMPIISRSGLAPRLVKRIPDAMSSTFDRRYNINTSGVVHVDELGISDSEIEDAHRYQPTSPSLLAALIEHFDCNYEDFAFIDLGSGKGRTLIVAAEFPFKKVVGVELSENLNSVAVQNIANSKSKHACSPDVRSVQMNALDFQFPDEAIFLYLFNPFGLTTFQQVLSNLENSLEKKPRPAIILYNNDYGKELLENSEFLNPCSLPSIAPSTFSAYRTSP